MVTQPLSKPEYFSVVSDSGLLYTGNIRSLRRCSSVNHLNALVDSLLMLLISLITTNGSLVEVFEWALLWYVKEIQLEPQASKLAWDLELRVYFNLKDLYFTHIQTVFLVKFQIHHPLCSGFQDPALLCASLVEVNQLDLYLLHMVIASILLLRYNALDGMLNLLNPHYEIVIKFTLNNEFISCESKEHTNHLLS